MSHGLFFIHSSDSAYARSNGAGNACAAEPAIAIRILCQILLVIILGKIEGRRIKDFGCDRAIALLGNLVTISLARGFRRLALRVARYINAGAVLRADIIALPHALRGIVRFPESLE